MSPGALPAVIADGPDAVPVPWQAVYAGAPQMATTMVAYVAQMGVSMRPSTARAIDADLRIFAGFLIDHDPALCAVVDIERPTSRPSSCGSGPSPARRVG